MTTGEMLDITNRFNHIKQIKCVYERDKKLNELMTEMEQTYNIPLLKNANYESRNPYLMAIYRTISYARDL